MPHILTLLTVQGLMLSVIAGTLPDEGHLGGSLADMWRLLMWQAPAPVVLRSICSIALVLVLLIASGAARGVAFVCAATWLAGTALAGRIERRELPPLEVHA